MIKKYSFFNFNDEENLDDYWLEEDKEEGKEYFDENLDNLEEVELDEEFEEENLE